MRYAIGEIALVVIGILLAVQINNWNEERKLNNNVEDLLKVFETELEENIENCNSLIRWGYGQDSIKTLFDEDKVTREMLAENPSLGWRPFSISMRDFEEENLNELISLEKNLPNKYLPLVKDLKLLKTRIDSRKKWEDLVVKSSLDISKEMDDLSWLYKRDSISKENRLDYLTGPVFFNKMKRFNRLQLSENIWDATLIRTTSIVILWKIKNMGNENSTGELKEFLNSHGLKPWLKLDCDQRIFTPSSSLNFRTNYVIYNNLQKEVDLNSFDLNGVQLPDNKLQPKAFFLAETDQYDGYIIEVKDDDRCTGAFGFVKDGYIIIDDD